MSERVLTGKLKYVFTKYTKLSFIVNFYVHVVYIPNRSHKIIVFDKKSTD